MTSPPSRRWRSPTPSIGVAVELEHDVADAQAGARRGTRLQQLHDLETTRPADPRRDRLGQRAGAADDPEVGAPDAAVDA